AAGGSIAVYHGETATLAWLPSIPGGGPGNGGTAAMTHLLALMAGVAVALEGPLNAALQQQIGLAAAVLANCLVVLAGSLVMAWLLRHGSRPGGRAPWPVWL